MKISKDTLDFSRPRRMGIQPTVIGPVVEHAVVLANK